MTLKISKIFAAISSVFSGFINTAYPLNISLIIGISETRDKVPKLAASKGGNPNPS